MHLLMICMGSLIYVSWSGSLPYDLGGQLGKLARWFIGEQVFYELY